MGTTFNDLIKEVSKLMYDLYKTGQKTIKIQVINNGQLHFSIKNQNNQELASIELNNIQPGDHIYIVNKFGNIKGELDVKDIFQSNDEQGKDKGAILTETQIVSVGWDLVEEIEKRYNYLFDNREKYYLYQCDARNCYSVDGALIEIKTLNGEKITRYTSQIGIQQLDNKSVRIVNLGQDENIRAIFPGSWQYDKIRRNELGIKSIEKTESNVINAVVLQHSNEDNITEIINASIQYQILAEQIRYFTNEESLMPYPTKIKETDRLPSVCVNRDTSGLNHGIFIKRKDYQVSIDYSAPGYVQMIIKINPKLKLNKTDIQSMLNNKDLVFPCDNCIEIKGNKILLKLKDCQDIKHFDKIAEHLKNNLEKEINHGGI